MMVLFLNMEKEVSLVEFSLLIWQMEQNTLVFIDASKMLLIIYSPGSLDTQLHSKSLCFHSGRKQWQYLFSCGFA
jgi:hypothetical protein